MEATLTLPQIDLAPDIVDKAKSENPSSSGDPWWDDPRNVAMVKTRIAKLKTSELITWESIKAKYKV